ncbi:MAG: peroxide stress protein YaaA [Alkalibacterium sp.]|nr:peroxide stress protein YaaA [Alkalibacterium sp.]
MRIIISPAKKMTVDNDSFSHNQLPKFINRTEELLSHLKSLTYDELKKIWKASDKIATLNYERIQEMDLRKNLTPAILAYEGIQYQYMASGVLETEQYNYLEKHLRILSGFYGVLKPFDGVTPYRLEMQAKLKHDSYPSVYAFWYDQLAKQLLDETDTIINLASEEYSKTITKYNNQAQIIRCKFGELKDGKVKEKGTMVKMARGEMVRFMAENQVEIPEEIKAFNHSDFAFSDDHSTENEYVFIKQ